MGGLQALLEIMVAHEDDGVRKNAGQVFNAVTGNNLKVQTFAAKTGAINLAAQLDREQTPAMREVMIGSLSAFMKAENFPGKRQYILHQRGLEQLGEWISLSGPEKEKKIGKAAQARKITIKFRQLLYDLLSNDDSILNDGFLVRDTISENVDLIDALIDTIR